MGIKLKESGEHDFVVLKKADSVGGTWRENTYPGCACDVQSHLYSFSFEPNPKWSRMFATQPEIRARFDEGDGLWHLEVNGGESRFTTRVLVAGFGPLSRPEYPQIDGVDKFEGKFFHSAQWDSDYDLRGKRAQ